MKDKQTVEKVLSDKPHSMNNRKDLTSLNISANDDITDYKGVKKAIKANIKINSATGKESLFLSSQVLLKLCDEAVQIIREAATLMTSRQSGQQQQEAKQGTANFVTETDYAVQNKIFNALRKLTPDFSLLGEESDDHQTDFSRPVWILDPVDGTTNLMFGYQHSAVSLSLYDGQSIVLAITYNPYLDELFTAVTGQGFFLNGRRQQARKTASFDQALIGFGTTPYDRQHSQQTMSLVSQFFKQAMDIRRSGSAVLDLAYVACGRLDAFFELTLQPWDYAAGLLFISEAGGLVTNWLGQPPAIRKADSILAAGSKLHPVMLDMIQDSE